MTIFGASVRCVVAQADKLIICHKGTLNSPCHSVVQFQVGLCYYKFELGVYTFGLCAWMCGKEHAETFIHDNYLKIFINHQAHEDLLLHPFCYC